MNILPSVMYYCYDKALLSFFPVPRSNLTATLETSQDITTDENLLSLITLSVELTPVTDWYKLGTSLGLKYLELRAIESRNPGPKQCKLDVLDTWLHSHLNPSWGLVVDALYEMGEDSVAERIKQEYIHASGIHL